MYKDIIVCLNESDGRENTIKAATLFAKTNDAKLTGLYVRVRPSAALGPYGYISEEIAKDIQKHEDDRAGRAKKSFKEVTGDLDVLATWLEVEESQHPIKAMAYYDLIVTNQVAYDPRQGHSNMNFVNTLILESGKPVILIPDSWDGPAIGSNVVVGWDESREAIRAIQDAMPLLQNADHVEAVCVNCGDDEGDSIGADQISSYLTSHNVTSSFRFVATDDRLKSPQKVILDLAERCSADLIVIGGYGHTRLREIILGGVTRFLSKNSSVPVLFSH